MVDLGNVLLPHFIYCKGDYFYGEEKTLKDTFLTKMYEYSIQSSIITELKMIRKHLITKAIADAAAEGMLKNDAEWKQCEGSINDDLDSFLNKFLNQEEIDDERVESFFLPRLTKKQLKLVSEKDKEYMTTFLLRNPDVDVNLTVKEKPMSDSSHEINLGKKKFRLNFRIRKYVYGRCWRRSYHLNIEPNQFSPKHKTSDEESDFVEMIDANVIGEGGFGTVFKGFFRGELKAMKCVWIDPESMVKNLDYVNEELRNQLASGGSGILVPEAYVRQLNQEQNDKGEWIQLHYNILIYPLYDCNLYELHEKFYNQFTEEILRDIMNQCLIRKCKTVVDYS